MADVLRRQKDQIKKMTSSYLTTTTTSEYLRYFEGSPTYINYYRQDTSKTTPDIGLEAVHSFIGTNTPKVYEKINDVQVWGVDGISPSNDIVERGLVTASSGELLFLPNTVVPYAGDYFVFNYDGLTSHLFKINDVQFDKLSNPKYYRCSFSLVNENADTIEQNVSKEYNLEYSGSGTELSAKLVDAETVSDNENIKEFTDKIIDKYTKLFYDEDMDTFIYKSNKNGEYYWSPYLQHFLHKNKVMNKNYQDLLTEIYIMDINETDNLNVFNEDSYRKSIFRNIEILDPEFNFDCNFLSILDYDIKLTRNLPFFLNEHKINVITPVQRASEDDPSAFLNAFPIFFGGPEKMFRDTPHTHKVHIMDELHIARLDGIIKKGDIVYECNRHELEPTKICCAFNVIENGETFTELHDVSLEKLMEFDNDLLGNNFIFSTIKNYLNGDLEVTDEFLNKLDDYFYKNSLENYILIPLIIYILKNQQK